LWGQVSHEHSSPFNLEFHVHAWGALGLYIVDISASNYKL
jgi:hypothetical protein